MTITLPTLANIYTAKLVVDKYLKRTPLVYSKKLSNTLDCSVYLKLENIQPIGSFKIRGGIFYLHTMQDEARKRGVTTASTGNHAQSIAYASSIFGVQATIVMPNGVSQVKVDAVKQLGGKVITYGSFFDESIAYARKLSAEKGSLLVHPIDEPLLYEGIDTMHLEVFEELPDLDVEINPIGGDSGASSACIVYKGLKPSTIIIGIQAEGAPAFYRSWKTGKIVTTPGVNTKAEGLATSTAYELPLTILRAALDDIILVNDNEMMHAVYMLLLTDGQIAELSGAAATAAAFKICEMLRRKKAVIPITGRNIQPEMLRDTINNKFS